jgi:hypothetical protein
MSQKSHLRDKLAVFEQAFADAARLEQLCGPDPEPPEFSVPSPEVQVLLLQSTVLDDLLLLSVTTRPKVM